MRVFKLIRLEIGFLKKSIALIGVILVAFISALLSVVSVLLDVPDGMYAGINEFSNYHGLQALGVKEGFAAAGGTAFGGKINGLTQYCTITGTTSLNISAHKPASKDDEEDTEVEVAMSFTGFAVLESMAEQVFAPYQQYAQSATYAFPARAGEICINKSVANLMGAKIGSEVTVTADPYFFWREDITFSDREISETYTVVGYLDNTSISRYNGLHSKDVYLPSAYFYLIPKADPVYTSLYYYFTDAKTLHRTYLSLTHSGYGVTLSGTISAQISNIGMAQALFGAVTGVLAILVLFILYTLIAIFFRQRRAQICRLKLLGARNGVIAAVYCLIAIFLIVVAIVAGSAFSMAFNVYFIGLCGRLFRKFSANFISNFRPVVPAFLLLFLTVYTLLLFFFVVRKIKNTAIAREVRNE